jgi:carboxyl-terminal processing protease
MQPEHLPGSADPGASQTPRRRAGLTLGAFVLAIVLFVGGVAADRAGLVPWGPGAPVANRGSDYALIGQAWDLLSTNYVDRSSIDWHQVAYGAIGGMTQAIGDVGHTSFLTPEQLSAEQASLSGSYVGIGAVIDMSNATPVIVSVFPRGPAAGAGLQHGDSIVSIDGTSTQGMSLTTVSTTIRGPSGTTVTLVVMPSAGGAQRTVRIVRAKVDVPLVTWAMVPGQTVADIQIGEFSTGAADDLKTALAAAAKAGATGIVLDLRNNPGGYVGEAVGVASQFIRTGTVYIKEDASGTKTPIPVKSGTEATSLPMVVLVNHGTASAAEIVAGALQDHQRATIVGDTTFGTGTTLLQFDLADGSALQIGTEKWLTPSGRQIWHHGIVPNDAVALPSTVQPLLADQLRTMTPAALAAAGDAQLARAIVLLGGS